MVKYARLVCSEETKNMITEECVEEFRKHHPEFDGKQISQEHILRQIARYYLK